MNVIDTLKAARAEVERGWCKGILLDRNQSVCAMGAIYRASQGVNAFIVGGTDNYRCVTVCWSQEVQDARETLEKYLTGFVEQFNDSPNTTKQDVLDLFDKALANLGAMA